jgi:hypothetical protein
VCAEVSRPREVQSQIANSSVCVEASYAVLVRGSHNKRRPWRVEIESCFRRTNNSTSPGRICLTSLVSTFALISACLVAHLPISSKLAWHRNQENLRRSKRSRKRLVLAAFNVLVNRVSRDLFVILLQRRQILSSLGKFTLLHTFTNVPMNKGTLAVHEVELVIQS